MLNEEEMVIYESKERDIKPWFPSALHTILI